MTGKTVLFTGASRGLGRFAAIELARLGAQILVVGHNRERAEALFRGYRRGVRSRCVRHLQIVGCGDYIACPGDIPHVCGALDPGTAVVIAAGRV